jgi:DNA-binding protein HU-beta
MNKNELIEAVAKAAGVSKAQAAKTIDATTEAIKKALSKKKEVRLIGFGTFLTRARKASTGRNPRTGKPIKISASNQAKFRPGKALKDAINK